MKTTRFPAQKIASLGLLTALGLIAFIIENQFPPLFVPGSKMGLANIFSLAALIMYGPAEGFIVVGVRTLLGSLFSGNVSSVMYSFTGGVVSLAVSAVLMYAVYPRVSLLAVSIAAAVMHNITQNAVYVLITDTPLMFVYMPYLALIGVLSGAIVGAVVALIFKKVPQSVFEKALSQFKSKEKDLQTVKPKKNAEVEMSDGCAEEAAEGLPRTEYKKNADDSAI